MALETKNEAFYWSFKPKYSRDTEVWWVDTEIRAGLISGLYFENTDRIAIMYEVVQSSGPTLKSYDIMEDKLFSSKEALLKYLKDN